MRGEVIVGPQSGVDVGVVDIGHDQVAVLTTDPLYIFPPFGWDRAAWCAIHIIASDAFTSGIAPQYMSIDLTLPLDTDDRALESIWTAIHCACDDLGVAVVTGHTGRYEGCEFPIVGSATMIGIGPSGGYVVPSMARVGDHVIVTKGPAIEATATLAAACPKLVGSRCGQDCLRQAQALLERMSVVDDAKAAIQAGIHDRGVTSMHDATEGGLWNALAEVSRACQCGMRVDRSQIPMPQAVSELCAAFNLDPFVSSSEGTLVITCRPGKSADVISILGQSGIEAAVIGEMCGKHSGVMVAEGAVLTELPNEFSDPFWPVLRQALPEEATLG
ncbi:MAG TPA: AIR synthase family protein [candidate division Zixibacteria bacterium]|jgi:hydrogenase maturation factor